MARYVLVYTGGRTGADPEEQQAIIDRWMGWFGALGTGLLDGGSPFGPSSTVTAEGSSDGGASSLTGYTIIAAADLAAATEAARGCPVLAAGGTVEVYETVEMG